MSNPTTKVATFNGTLEGFTGVDPIRYSSGLWLEEGTTNYVTNPSAESNVTDKIGSGGMVVTQSSEQASAGTYSVKAVGDNGSFVRLFDAVFGSEGVLTNQPVALSADIMSNDSLSSTIITVHRNSGVTVETPVNAVEAFQPTLTRQYWTITPTDAAARTVRLHVGHRATNKTIYADRLQAEKKAYATSYADLTMGSGYGDGGSGIIVRAASSAAISPSGILSPSSGALAFRITPTIETGVEEIWGECGVKGSGTDHVRWGRDSSKHPFVEWSANNASYQRLTGSETLNALTAYDLYLGHSTTTISLAVDAGSLQTGTRDAISDSWGAGNLKLEATAGGVVYNQFAAFNRTLSASEIKTLDRRNSWSRTMFGNPFAYFQLRPY